MKQDSNSFYSKASEALRSGVSEAASRASFLAQSTIFTTTKVSSLLSKKNLDDARRYLNAYGLRKTAAHTVDLLRKGSRYNEYVKKHSADSETLARQAEVHFPYEPVISIIVPTYNTPWDYLVEMIESVVAQSYPNWELCIADGSPDHTLIQSVVRSFQRRHPSILLKALEENLGIAGNTNAALSLAGGDYIALLDHDDFLTPDALYEVVRMINQHPGAQVLYSDEDKYDSALKRYYDPNLKPDFDQDYLLCCNYITHFYVVRKSIVDQVKGFSTTMDGSQDYDFILRTTQKAQRICHIPRVLYHWRIHTNSVAGDPTSKMYAYDAAENALNSYFQRTGVPASSTKTENLGFYRTRYQLQGQPLVSVVLTNCAEASCLRFREKTDYDRFELAERYSDVKGDYVLFLDHVAALPDNRSWLSDLVSNCQRPEVGIAAGKVMSSADRIYEYGLIYDQDGMIASPFFRQSVEFPGYYHLTDSQHCVSLVGRHFLLIRRADLDQFIKKTHPKKLNERFFYELCLDLREKEKRITLLPYVSVTLTGEIHGVPLFYRFEQIPDYIRSHPHDPMYNPVFSVSRPYSI